MNLSGSGHSYTEPVGIVPFPEEMITPELEAEFFPAQEITARQMPLKANPLDEDSADSEHHTMHYQIHGDLADVHAGRKIPIIHLHGGPGVGTAPQDARLYPPDQYVVITFAQRGARGSGNAGELRDNKPQFIIEDVKQLIEDLGIDSAVIAGGSWGTTPAMMFAQKYPEMTDGLMLRGSDFGSIDELKDAYDYPNPEDALEEAFMAILNDPRVPNSVKAHAAANGPLLAYQWVFEHGDPEMIAAAETALLGLEFGAAMTGETDDGLVSPEEAMVRDELLRKAYHVLALYYAGDTYMRSGFAASTRRQSPVYDKLDVIREHGIPTYLVVGAADKLTPAETSDMIAERLGDIDEPGGVGKLDKVPGGAHSTFSPPIAAAVKSASAELAEHALERRQLAHSI